jgi:hypothetical protein
VTVRCGLGIFEEYGADNGQTSTRGLFGKRVEVRHEPIALLDKTAANRLMNKPSNPGLLVAGAEFRVIAIYGLKGGDLHPAGRHKIGHSQKESR